MARRNKRPAYDERTRQNAEIMRRGTLPTTHHESLPSPARLEKKLASQAAEIDQLSRDNQKLTTGHLALRQDLAAAKGEVENLRKHMSSIQTEGDIQIRILLDKIAEREADIRAGDIIKRELQEAHIESRSVMTAKLDLSVKIEQATKELEYSRKKIEKLPEMRAELDSLKQEYQRLRKTFDYEKGLNKEKVEQLKHMEKELIRVVEEVERLRAEATDAEKRASVPVPRGGPYMNPNNLHPPPFHGNGSAYADSFGRPYAHTVHGAPAGMMHPYANGGFAGGPPGPIGYAGAGAPVEVMHPYANGGFAVGPGPVAGAGGNAGWGGVYGTSHTQM